LRGAFWHIMQTFVGSHLIIVAAAVIYFTGFLPIDPLRNRFGFYFSSIQIETKCLDEDHAKDLDISALLRLPKPDRTRKTDAPRHNGD
jgi:hypothetical protein